MGKTYKDKDKYEQKVKIKQVRCDHEFADSKVCIKCGWNPDE